MSTFGFVYIFCTYFLTRSSGECTDEIQASGMKAMVVLGGIHLNATSGHGESINDAIYNLDESEPCSAVVGDASSSFPSIYSWAAGKEYYAIHSDVQMQSVIDFYADLSAVNFALQGRDLPKVPNENIWCFGTMILCGEVDVSQLNETSTENLNFTACSDRERRIGPDANINSRFMEHRPIDMNSDWSTESVIQIVNQQRTASDHIDVLILFYALKSEPMMSIFTALLTDIFTQYTAIISHTVIPKYQTSDSLVEFGTLELSYTNIDDINADLGQTSEWDSEWHQWYYVPELYDGNAIVYIYGITALCSNEYICQQWTDAQTTQFEKTWITISVIFIILFLVALCVIVFFLCRFGYCGISKNKKTGYSATVQDEDDHETYVK